MRCIHDFKTVIPNLGYAYPLGYEPGYIGLREKKLNIISKHMKVFQLLIN